MDQEVAFTFMKAIHVQLTNKRRNIGMLEVLTTLQLVFCHYAHYKND